MCGFRSNDDNTRQETVVAGTARRDSTLQAVDVGYKLQTDSDDREADVQGTQLHVSWEAGSNNDVPKASQRLGGTYRHHSQAYLID